MKQKRYYLFTSIQHEDVRLDFTEKTITRFLELWEADYTHEFICRRLRIEPVELALIAMDLDHAGRLPERKNGFWGNREANEKVR